ncbi:MAG: tail fiber protein [Methanosphaera sp.]|nr:tail fiber protein [Methanobrevibacter sp.]MBQ6754241.1 tail fiber protein [Bacteroidales bacterium]MBR0351313.1 tail fiber protein [Clostridia bacterium]MBR0473199.1 tail fiber protein [Methanosphaera sp.]
MSKFLDEEGLKYYETTVKARLQNKQDKLQSGENIKTINNESLLGSGNINISSGGTATDVRINGTSITSNDVADIQTQGTYNSSTNKIATMSDIPTVPTVGNAKTYYGTSTTGATTAAKTVTCSGFTLETGATIFVKFTNANTYNGTATLNVNSTGAKTICSVGTTETTRYYWKAGEVVGFVYDGTNYVMIEKAPATTTYYGITKLSSSTTSTSEALAATPKAVKTAYDLADSKQDEITSTNKLDYSLIDNTPTIPTKVSDLTNDTGFITNTVNNLTNYYTTSNTYTKSEVDTLIGAISTLNIQVVQSLPSTGSTTTIYLVPKTASTNDAYDEYIYVNNSWEHIGSTEVDLSNYYNKSQVDTLLNDKADTSDIPTKVSDLQNDSGYISSYTETDPTVPSYVKSITQANITSWNNKSDFSGSYNDLTNKPTIPDSTSDLTNDSGFIDNTVSNLTNYTTTTALQTLLDGKMDWTELSSSTVRIWDLEPGAYKTTTAATLYYNGASGSGSERIGNGALIFVSESGTTTKAFYVLASYRDATTQVLYFNNYVGYTSSTEGYCYENLHTGDVVDNLTSTLASSPLSAKQGKALKDLIDGLATVASTGDYDDLTNKPTIPTVPTTVSSFTNDAGYITSSALSGYATTSALDDVQDQVDANSANIISNSNKIGTLANLTTTDKTDLVSAINEVNGPIIDIDDVLAITSPSDTLFVQLTDLLILQQPFYIDDGNGVNHCCKVIYEQEEVGTYGEELSFVYGDNYDFYIVTLITGSGNTVAVTKSPYSVTNAKINGTRVSDILTNTAYNSSSNKLATMSDVYEKIVDYTFESDLTTVSFDNLNILPGEKYKFKIVGAAVSSASDVYMRFNDDESTQYFQCGTYINGTLTANGNLTESNVYRQGETAFRIGNSLRTQLTTIEGTIELRYNITNSRNCPFFTWHGECLWNGQQYVSDMVGIYGQSSVDSITKLTFSGPTFKTGTKIQLIKVKNEFTI